MLEDIARDLFVLFVAAAAFTFIAMLVEGVFVNSFIALHPSRKRVVESFPGDGIVEAHTGVRPTRFQAPIDDVSLPVGPPQLRRKLQSLRNVAEKALFVKRIGKWGMGVTFCGILLCSVLHG